MARLAILAEDHDAANALAAYLAHQGVMSGHWRTLTDLLLCFERDRVAQRPDVVILEAGSMLSAALLWLSRIRRISDVPCIVLGSETDDVERIVLLEAGADDVLAMPINQREILARVQVMLRRRGQTAPAPAFARAGRIETTRQPCRRTTYGSRQWLAPLPSAPRPLPARWRALPSDHREGGARHGRGYG